MRWTGVGRYLVMSVGFFGMILENILIGSTISPPSLNRLFIIVLILL